MKKKTITGFLSLLLIAALLLGGCSKTPSEVPADTAGQNTQGTAGQNAPDTGAQTAPNSAGQNAPDTGAQTAPDTAGQNAPDTGAQTVPADTSGQGSFSDAAAFTYAVNSDGTLTLTGYTGRDSYVRIPSSIDGCSVTAIGESCFAGNIYAERISVPEGVTAVEAYAFECCSILKKVYLPDSLTKIGDGVFSGCCSLYLIDIQDNVEEIGKGAFLECTSLVSFIAPKSLRTVGNFAFAGCKELIKADFINSALEAVTDRMFYSCSSLSTVRLPEGISAVGVRAFSNNTGINYLYLPDSVKSIGAYAFEFCSNLQNFTVTCDVVEPYTFNCCSSLSYVSFPETLKEIGAGAFKDTPLAPEYLEIPESALVAEDAFGHITGAYEEGGYDEASTDSNVNADYDTTVSDIEAKAKADGFRTITSDEFFGWSQEYLDFNSDNALLSNELNPYIAKYKGEIGYYFKAMTAVASGVEAEIEAQKENFGDDFEEMYLMINHGLDTEMKRFRMKDDLLLYTGVYDFQLATAAGTDHIPTIEELKGCVGKTFTDACLTSTSTEADVAFGFSDTLFIIYAPAENLNALGSVCIDSYLLSVENEILLCSGATYEITGAGVLQGTLTDWSGEQHEECRNYVMLKLINE